MGASGVLPRVNRKSWQYTRHYRVGARWTLEARIDVRQ